MATQTYQGSCHCGKIKYEAKLDLSKGGGRCNCSMCVKTRNWSATLKPEEFKLLSGKNDLSDYKFNTESTHNYFCKHCGVRSFTEGNVPELGGHFFTVRLNCLDLKDEEFAELGNAPTRYLDGRADNWFHEPKLTNYL